jgi:hypothetical protein
MKPLPRIVEECLYRVWFVAVLDFGGTKKNWISGFLILVFEVPNLEHR